MTEGAGGGEPQWVLDAYPDRRTDRMVVWLVGPRGPRRLAFPYLPEFYIHSPSDIGRARRYFSNGDLYECGPDRKRLLLGSEKLSPVLRVTPRALGLHVRAARAADFFGGYGRLRFFNLDIDLAQRFLLQEGLFPLARARWLGPGWEVVDNRLSVHYPLPRLKVARLGVSVRRSGILPSLQDPLERAELSGERLEGSEESVLRELLLLVRRKDPDVVLTEGGDSFVLPYLYERARRAGIPGFWLGREGGPAGPQRREKSYFTYGRILHRPAAYYLRGRLHVDARSSFLYQEGGLEGILELSRLSGITFQRMARSSPGTAISAMEVNLVLSEGGVVAWKKNLPEDFKSLRCLLSTDRGGFIFEPRVGLHERVLEVDFASMYPQIMVIHNISPETVNCACCTPREDGRAEGEKDEMAEGGKVERAEGGKAERVEGWKGARTEGGPVPGIGYWTCRRRVGIIPRLLEPLVSRRREFKRLRKRSGDRWDRKARCLKPLLVTCFGYTGYRNAPFGRIECHESINAHGREALLTSASIAQGRGFDVLHGMVDSLWLKGPLELKDGLVRDIALATGIPLTEEGVYRWVVFLPDKLTGAGALNRYFGLFESGEFKLRGIALRKHDTPEAVRKLQADMLEALGRASSAGEFLERVPEAVDELRKHSARLLDGRTPLDELVLTKRVSRTVDEYVQLNDTFSALRKLRDAGVTVPPGEAVRYIVAESSDRKLKAVPVQMLKGSESYDRGEYLKLLLRAAGELLTPFGYDAERLERVLGGDDSVQAEL